MRFCGGQNISLCEGLAACRRIPASRVLWCRGRVGRAAFVRDVVWPAGILGGVCGAGGGAWRTRPPGPAVASASGLRRRWCPREVHGRLRGGPKLTGVSPATRPTIGRMPSYEPVDLSGVCNAGVDVLGDEPGDVPLGRVDLRGLPFL